MINTQALLDIFRLNLNIVCDNGVYKTEDGFCLINQQRASKAYNERVVLENIKEDSELEKAINFYIENVYKINKLKEENKGIKNYIKYYVNNTYLKK